MASKGPRCKLDHETRAKRQKVGLLDILFVDYLVFFWGHKSIAVFVTFFFSIFSAMVLFAILVVVILISHAT